MARYVLINAIDGRRAGETLDDLQGDAAAIAGILQLGGVLVLLPSSLVEAAAEQATAAYARGAGDAVANGIMLAGYTQSGAGGSPCQTEDVHNIGDFSCTEGVSNYALGRASLATGEGSTAGGDYSIAMGNGCGVAGQSAQAFGQAQASANQSHAESTSIAGTNNQAFFPVTGSWPRVTINLPGDYTAEFQQFDSVVIVSVTSIVLPLDFLPSESRVIVTVPVFAAGETTFDLDSPIDLTGRIIGLIVDTTIGERSHAEGANCQTLGTASHAEGQGCITQRAAPWSHVQGFNCETTAPMAHAAGTYAIGHHPCSEVLGVSAFGPAGAQRGRSVHAGSVPAASLAPLVGEGGVPFAPLPGRLYSLHATFTATEANTVPLTNRVVYGLDALVSVDALGVPTVAMLSLPFLVQDPDLTGSTASITAGPASIDFNFINATGTTARAVVSFDWVELSAIG